MDSASHPGEMCAPASGAADPPSDIVAVELFAGMAAAAGRRRVTLPWKGGDVAALRAAVSRACPGLALLLPRSAVVVGDRYAADTDAVPGGATVALIPPVSGG